MTAKTEDINVRPCKVDLFAVVTARPRLGTWSINTLRVESTRFLILQTLPHTSSGQENLCRGESPPKFKKYAKGPRESFFFSHNKTINICQHWSGLLRLRSVGTLKSLWKCSRTFATNWWECLVKAPRSSRRKERQLCREFSHGQVRMNYKERENLPNYSLSLTKLVFNITCFTELKFSPNTHFKKGKLVAGLTVQVNLLCKK